MEMLTLSFHFECNSSYILDTYHMVLQPQPKCFILISLNPHNHHKKIDALIIFILQITEWRHKDIKKDFKTTWL